jgi:hypothetical protein
MFSVRLIAAAAIGSLVLAKAAWAQEAEQFLQGAWRTDADHRTYAVSSGLPAAGLDATIIFGSSYFEDGVDLTHQVTTDRGTYTVANVTEASGTMIEGKNIELRQSNSTGGMVGGTWRAVTQPIAPTQFSKFHWTVYPGRSSLVLNLARPRQFVLTFTGHTNAACNKGQVRVFVDGNQLKYRSGANVTLLPQTSIWSQGKVVTVVWDGDCAVPNPPPTGATPLGSGIIKVANLP